MRLLCGLAAWAVLAGVSPPARAAACGGGPCALPPEPWWVLLRPGTTDVILRSNAGLVVSADAGKSWHLVCEELYGSTLVEGDDVDSTGKLFVSTYDGLFTTTDLGCRWATATGDVKDHGITDVAFDPFDPSRVWAMTYLRATGTATVQLSVDGGATFTKRATFGANHRLNQIAIAPSDPNTIYIAGYKVPTYAFVIEYSIDGGMTWTEELPASGFMGSELRLLGISPVDPKTIYVSRLGLSGTPDDIWRSNDHGRGSTKILTLDGEESVRGFAFGPTVQTVYLAGLVAGRPGDPPPRGTLYISHDAGDTFLPALKGGPGYRCLGFRDGKLWACGGDEAGGDPFALATSLDEGQTWTKVFAFKDLSGAIGCAGNSCDATLAWMCDLYGVCNGAPARSDGGPQDADIDVAGDRPGPDDSGCGCGVGAPTDVPGEAAASLVLLFALARRRRGRRR